MPTKKPVTNKPVEKEVKAPTSVSILQEGVLIRSYSKDVHGDDFMKLAESFAKKNGAEIK